MKYYLISTPLGTFAFDSSKKLIDMIWSEGTDQEKLKLFEISKGEELSSNESDIVRHIISKDKDAKIIFENRKSGYMQEFPNAGGTALREDIRSIIESSKKFRNMDEYYEKLLELTLLLTKDRIRQSVTDDMLIIQAINAVDDIESAANMLSTRLREWYGYMNPELSEKFKQHEQFVSKIIESPDEKTLMGASLDEPDRKEIEVFAAALKHIYDEKDRLERYIDTKAKDALPNTTALISPILTARLLSAGGSLKKLSKFPSSTIQVIGAEKALFRHIRGTGTSPKHGLIFQAPAVNQAKKDKRGKIARMLASKLSIALKVDYFKGTFIGDKLKKNIEDRTSQIKDKNSKKTAEKSR